MDFDLTEAISLLARGPANFDALLRDLPESAIRANEGEYEGEPSWSPFEVMGHLVYVERNDWMVRARRILEHGEARSFDPIDRFAQRKQLQASSVGQLLDELASLRAENLAELRGMNLTTEDLNRKGTHPTFGPVTLSQLLATWTTHDLTHLHQLTRVMAYRYRDAVGPWTAFLGVLQCNGHSRS
jgi:hypothetical protein